MCLSCYEEYGSPPITQRAHNLGLVLQQSIKAIDAAYTFVGQPE